MTWIWLLLALVPLTIVASGVLLCLPYWRSPEKRWRDRVLSTYQAAQRQAQYEHAEIQRLSKNRRGEIQSLSGEVFEQFLSSISVTELEAYPGIGPATIGRLREAGYSNLARLQNARLRVPGLGQKRLGDVNGAVRQLTRQAESRFQAGACPESQQMAAQLQQLEARYAKLDARAKARVQGAADVVRQLEPSAAIARQVTLWNYFWKDAHVVVPPELLHRALPDVRSAVESVEQQASKALRGSEATGESLSQISSRTLPITGLSPAPEASPVAGPPAVAKPPPTAAPLHRGTKAEGPTAVRSADHRSSSLHPALAPTANRSSQPPMASDPAHELLEATIEFAFAIARTDGSISHQERAFLAEQVQRRYGQDAALHNRAKAWCAHYETGAIDIGNCLQRIRECFTPSQRAELFELACRLAQASGPMNQREVRLLARASQEWGVPWKTPAVAVVAPHPAAKSAPTTADVSSSSSVLEPRATLEIEPSAQLTAELIRRQYNLLSSRLALEKVESMGPEFVAMAQSKRQAIRAAAETLLQPWGEPLDLPARPAEPAELRHNPDLDAMFGA